MEEVEEDAMEASPTSMNSEGLEGITGSRELMVDGKTESEVPEHYDPTEDDNNDIWVAKQRQGRKSDAVLSCPACFAILCIDCQRHEIYVNQYRAMFVRNCKTVETERLGYPADKKRMRNGRRKRGRQQDIGFGDLVRIDNTDAGVDEVFKAVQCAECNAKLAGIVFLSTVDGGSLSLPWWWSDTVSYNQEVKTTLCWFRFNLN